MRARTRSFFSARLPVSVVVLIGFGSVNEGTLPTTPAPGFPPRNAGLAIAVLVLGVVGLCLICAYGIGIIPAIVGLALAPGARRQIAESGGSLTGNSFIKTGVICSWVAIGLVIVAFVIGLIVLAVAAST